MSFTHSTCQQLPPPGGIKLDTNWYLSQYHIYRSFRVNFLTHHLTHTLVFALGDLSPQGIITSSGGTARNYVPFSQSSSSSPWPLISQNLLSGLRILLYSRALHTLTSSTSKVLILFLLLVLSKLFAAITMLQSLPYYPLVL
jgi:hypothetical protein